MDLLVSVGGRESWRLVRAGLEPYKSHHHRSIVSPVGVQAGRIFLDKSGHQTSLHEEQTANRARRIYAQNQRGDPFRALSRDQADLNSVLHSPERISENPNVLRVVGLWPPMSGTHHHSENPWR